MESRETQSKILIFDTTDQVALAAAEKFVAVAQQAIVDRGVFSVALAGGNTPRRVYELLASDSFKNLVEWSRVHLFFGDERCVPANHPDSNYGMVYMALISKIEIPSPNVHRIIGEGKPKENALAYEKELKTFFGEVAWPRLNLVLLGMGEDGHTASIFPGSDVVKESSNWVVSTKTERKQDRITLTIPVFNHAAQVVFVATGKAKAKRFADVVLRPGNIDTSSTTPFPASLIQPRNGSLEWLVDKEIASELERMNNLGC